LVTNAFEQPLENVSTICARTLNASGSFYIFFFVFSLAISSNCRKMFAGVI